MGVLTPLSEEVPVLINGPLLPLVYKLRKLPKYELSPLSDEVPVRKYPLFGEYFDLYGAK